MIIRKATISDVDGIMKLLYQVAEVHHNGRPDIFKGGCSKYTPKELEDIIADPTTPVLVADEAGSIIGHAFCVLKDTGENGVLVSQKSLYIDDICVDANQRGKHVGTRLYEAVKALAEREQCYNITLNVWCLNKSAMSFYRALGFKEQKIVMETVLGDK